MDNKYLAIAKKIVEVVGKDNILSATHCATRLRLMVKDRDAIDDKKVENCPNCGAPVDINASATCPYCNSTLVKVSSDYVLSKKECIGKKME